MEFAFERMPDHQNYFAFTYGPIVLAAATGTTDMQGLFADDSRGGQIAHGCQIPLQEVPMLIGETSEMIAQLKRLPSKQLAFEFTGNIYPTQPTPLTFIPFYNLHQSRYAFYFHVVNYTELNDLLQVLQSREAAAPALPSRTIDVIHLG